MNENKFTAIDTPSPLLREAILVRNITDMASFAREAGVDLRPHIKTHKIPRLARIQVNQGAVGITVAKLDEAEAMIDNGLRDVFVASPVTDPKKIKRLLRLAEKAEISVVADSSEGIEVLAGEAGKKNTKFKVLLEINSGYNLCGVLPGEEALKLAKKIQEKKSLDFAGIMTHAGHCRDAKNPEKVQEIGQREGRMMAELAEKLKKEGLPCSRVSVGSTPTAKMAGMIKGVTEVRPGNYVFNDLGEVALGVAMEEDCALTVLTRVVSRPTKERCIVDAGSKTLSLDRGVKGEGIFAGYGKVKGHPEIVVSRLAEEHGILTLPPESDIKVGDLLEIIPNHAGLVVNLASTVHIIRNEEIWEEWKVSAVGSK